LQLLYVDNLKHGLELEHFKLHRSAYIGVQDIDVVFRANCRGDMNCPEQRHGNLEVGIYVN
jgi:hypothetical protein